MPRCDVHANWVKLMQFCQKAGHGEMTLTFADGVPVFANSGPVPIDDRMLYADITKIVAVSRFVFFLLLSARLASYAFVPHSHHSVVLRRSFPSPSSSFM